MAFDFKAYHAKRAPAQKAARLAAKEAMGRRCVHCYGPIPPARNANAKSCSDECVSKLRYEKQKTPEGIQKSRKASLAWYHRKQARILAALVHKCLHCGNSFKPKSKMEHVCSDECRRLRINSKHRMTKTQQNAYHKHRHKTDPVYKLRKRVRTSVTKALKCFDGKSCRSLLSFLPYTIPQLKAHLESQFNNVNGFTWENHGKVWHIDHIIPASLFRFTSLDSKEFRDCWALSNLRPLTVLENLKKGAKAGFVKD